MARFDVYQPGYEAGLWLDCQADRLRHLSHRFVVPLLLPADAPEPRIDGLNPALDVEGHRWVMMTQFAATVPVSELGTRITTLDDHDRRIIPALDVLIGTT